MPTELASQVILLLFVVDPFGNVPMVNAMLRPFAPRRRRLSLLR